MKSSHYKGKPIKEGQRILIVTPEITYLPQGMGNMSNQMKAKAGGLADVSSTLVTELYNRGADVHVALPHYRKMFNIDVGRLMAKELRVYLNKLSPGRIHLAEDRAFYYCDSVYGNYNNENYKIALAFQREVINNIIPAVKPDLIHCNDWMTGLIPAYAKRVGIPCLFTIHNIHSNHITMETIEDRGIDAAEFWKYLYFQNHPHSYEESRSSNLVDMLGTGIFASSFINAVSPSFLKEIVDGYHDFIPPVIRSEIGQKYHHGFATGILNSPDTIDNPMLNKYLPCRYDHSNHVEAKRINKVQFQKLCGLELDPDAPILFWPSRLDPVQKGCQLLAHILYETIQRYSHLKLQVAFVANGSFQQVFKDIVNFHGLHQRVAVMDFKENLSHLGFGSSDFVLMPSYFEPCGLPQMIGTIYGTLPIAHATGGLKDTVEHLDVKQASGNGFSFKNYDPAALSWGIDEAMNFYQLPQEEKGTQISRIMRESTERFSHNETVTQYMDLYEKILNNPVIERRKML